MPNAIKYSTSAQTLALKKGNYWIGTGDVGKGPTSTTDYWNGITPPAGGYTIYLNKASGGPSIYTAANDSTLISLSNTIAGQTFANAAAALAWFATQTDKMVFDMDYPAIVTNGLVLNLDAGFTPSYPTTGTTWYDVGSGGNNGTLVNGPTFSSTNGGSIVFDGSDDYSLISNTSLLSFGTNPFSIGFWIYPTHTSLPSYRTILSNYVGYNSDYVSYFYLGIFNGNNISFLDSGGNFIIGFPSCVVSTNVWTHIAFTRSGNSISSYQNGAPQGSVSFSNNFSGVRTTKIGGGVTDTATFQGNLSIMSIYNRALSATEVQQNFNATKSRFGL